MDFFLCHEFLRIVFLFVVIRVIRGKDWVFATNFTNFHEGFRGSARPRLCGAAARSRPAPATEEG